MHFSPNLALQSSPTSTVIQQAVYEYIFVHEDHSAKSNDQTHNDICFEIENLIIVVSAKHDDEWLEKFLLVL